MRWSVVGVGVGVGVIVWLWVWVWVMVVSRVTHHHFVIIRQPYCPVVGRRPRHAVSKLACIVLSSTRSCCSSICPSCLSMIGWSPSSYFLLIWSPSGDTRGPLVVFEAVCIPCPRPFHFSHIADYIYEFCPLPNPDVGLTIFVCDVEHTSFRFGMCGR